jgi:2-polyprenyl-6-methoxyphenol hydroxylase-like FAD-dependent oxidoreductase
LPLAALRWSAASHSVPFWATTRRARSGGTLISRSEVMRPPNIIRCNRGRGTNGRIRAGVLEQSTVDTLTKAGVHRVLTEGIIHRHLELAFDGWPNSIDLHKVTNGRIVTAYGQTEVTRDLMHHRSAKGMTTIYDATNVNLQDFDSRAPKITDQKDGITHTIACDFIAGCDGFHSVRSRYYVQYQMSDKAENWSDNDFGMS